MQISNNLNFDLSFKATKIATTYNYVRGNTAIDIFRLSQKDEPFLEKLSQKVSIKNLCPKLLQSVQERWQKVFEYCIQEAKDPDNYTYVAFSSGTPCAILTYHEDDAKNNYLDGVSAIPDYRGKKTPLAGNTLLYQLFKDSGEAQNKKGIILEAVHDGPVDVVKLYENLGFTKISADEKYTFMSCNKFKVAKEIDSFKKNIDYEEINEENINLEEYID